MSLGASKSNQNPVPRDIALMPFPADSRLVVRKSTMRVGQNCLFRSFAGWTMRMLTGNTVFFGVRHQPECPFGGTYVGPTRSEHEASFDLYYLRRLGEEPTAHGVREQVISVAERQKEETCSRERVRQATFTSRTSRKSYSGAARQRAYPQLYTSACPFPKIRGTTSSNGRIEGGQVRRFRLPRR